MPPVVSALLALIISQLRSRLALHLQVLALQHQVAVYKQTVRRPRLSPTNRVFWSWLSWLWSGWQDVLAFVQPRTVIAWQYTRFRDYWRGLSQRGKPGRPAITKEVHELIRELDCPFSRPVSPPAHGRVLAVPEVGGLDRHYEEQQAA
jgi:hypothetical protein